MKKTTLVVLLFFFIPVLLINAQPQSFYISGNQTIKDYDIKRMYCLEYSKEVLTASNIAELTRIVGNVRVVYTNGRVQTTSLDQLLKSGAVSLFPYDSYEFLQFLFLDEEISEIQIGQDGIGLYREGMTANEETLAQTNIAKIKELEAQGKTHTEVQMTIWRTRTGEWVTLQDRLHVYDFMTTTAERERVSGSFGRTATVSYREDGKMFLRLDGLLSVNDNVDNQIIELITHYHNDHINIAEVEQAIREGSFSHLYAPYPAIAASRNRIFNSITEQAGVREYNFKQENNFIEVTPANIPLSRTSNITVGDFNYSSFRINEDMTVEMYKYRNPRNGEVNHDGLIYRFTHKNVSYLLFGDFDYMNGIENLLDASAANEEQYYLKSEEISNLEIQRLQVFDELELLLHYKEYYERLSQISDDDPDFLAFKRQLPEILEGINEQISGQERIIEGLNTEIDSLTRELSRLPFMKADVIKWPHHAHIEDNVRADSIIRKLNTVVDPQFIIWQTHFSQDADKFEEYIRQHFPDFYKKFLCSDTITIEFLSLLDLPDANEAS